MKTLLFCILVSFGYALQAQGTLEFNQVMIVNNSPQTVPAGKVWKITSVYGFNPYFCQNLNSTCYYGAGNSVSMAVSSFKINGNTVLSECTINRIYASTNCTSSNTVWSNAESSCGAILGAFGYANKSANPNLLPIWIPAGTVLQSDGTQVFLSVVEFNVIP